MKPIVRGCSAIIIRSEVGNDGKEVVAGKYLGTMEGYLYPHHWEISPGIHFINVNRRTGDRTRAPGLMYHASQQKLLRIDGHEGTEDDHTVYKEKELSKQTRG